MSTPVDSKENSKKKAACFASEYTFVDKETLRKQGKFILQITSL